MARVKKKDHSFRSVVGYGLLCLFALGFGSGYPVAALILASLAVASFIAFAVTGKKLRVSVGPWLFGAVACFGAFSALARHPQSAPPAPPAAYVPTAEERAQQARQAESDRKFFAQKGARDKAEAAKYQQEQVDAAAWQKQQELLSQTRAADTATRYEGSVDQGASQPLGLTQVPPSGGASYTQTRSERRPEDGAQRTVHVRGFFRNGTWVEPHERRAPSRH